MRRSTRSQSNAGANKKVEAPKYAEPSSDVDELEDESSNADPKPKSKPKIKTEKSQKVARKSTNKVKPKEELKDEDVSIESDTKLDESVQPVKTPDDCVDEQTNNEELTTIDYELSEKEIKQINKAFDMNLPSLGDENLASANVKTAMRLLGYEPRADEIRKLMKKFCNSKGKMNRNGFHKMMAYKYSTSPCLNKDKNECDEISKVFSLFDIDKTGKISLENLKSIAEELNEPLTEEEFLEMIAEADLDKDSYIDKVEFENIMKKTSLY